MSDAPTAAVDVRAHLKASRSLPLVLRKVFSDDELGDLLDVLFEGSDASGVDPTRQPHVTLINAVVRARELPR